MPKHNLSYDSPQVRALLTKLDNLEKVDPSIISEQMLLDMLSVTRHIIEDDERRKMVQRLNELDQRRYKARYPGSTRTHRPLSQKGKKVLKKESIGHKGSPQVTTRGPKIYTPYN